MERVNEHEPAVGVLRLDAGFEMPIRAVGLLDLRLREMDALQFRAGQRIQRERQPARVFEFAPAGDQPRARTARQQRNAGVDAQDFQRCFRVREKLGRHEHQAERNLRRGQLPPQILRPVAQAGFVKTARPMRRDGIFAVHRSYFNHATTFSPAQISFAGWRSRATAAATVHQNFGGQRAGIVIGRHDKAIGARAQQREVIAFADFRQRAILAKIIARLTNRPNHVGLEH